jgi:HD superfamily phosphohydrolase
MFLNMAAKADGEARKVLTRETEKIGEFLSPKSKQLIEKAILRSFPCSQTDAHMLAAIRVAALIHDIGHLPYSHVFENAMDGFLRGEFGGAIKLTKASEEKRAKLNALLASYAKTGDPEVKLHEILGKFFVEVLQKSFHDVEELSGLLKAALLILKTDTAPIANGILIGTIDADRIDFVRRDGFFSGLFNSSVDFGRLFAFYELALTFDEKTKTNVWRPRPSPRTVSETEKLLHERFLDYKYIVVHHRVHLYDEIMENVLVRLMASGKLDNFVNTLCWLLEYSSEKPERLLGEEERIKHLKRLLTEFDDPWVEVEIRRQYSDLDPAVDPTTRALFEAYVEDRHCFRSAFKTDGDFQSLCAEFAPELLEEDPTSIRNAFGASKYVLQKTLGDILKRTVLIGATDKKLSFGIRNDSAAKFASVHDLYEFLVRKKFHSLTFNFWYEDRGEDETQHKEIVAQALKFLQKTVAKQLQLPLDKAVAEK